MKIVMRPSGLSCPSLFLLLLLLSTNCLFLSSYAFTSKLKVDPSTKKTLIVHSFASSKKLPLSLSTNHESNHVNTKELIRFSLPTLGIWLLQPILSLVDTGFVGMNNKNANILELAALGPAIAWIDSTAYLFQFMGMATTNLYATALATGSKWDQDKVLSDAMGTAVFMGVLLFILQVRKSHIHPLS